MMTLALLLGLQSNMQLPNHEQYECMTKNIYFEARNQKEIGMIAVAQATINRYNTFNYGDELCDVIYYNLYEDRLHLCHFSWTCDTISDTPNKNKFYFQAREIALRAIHGEYMESDITMGADHYIRCDVPNPPDWTYAMEMVAEIGDHCFYDSEKPIKHIAKQ